MINCKNFQFSERYNFLSDYNLFVAKSHSDGIGYGDGAEAYLMQVVGSDVDISTSSNDINSQMNDWPSEYHLSYKRHLILEPLNIQAGQTVLELGCGCGALTRYLGETGAFVTAVEGEFSRAKVAAARTKDLPNVNVFVDDLLAVDFIEKFDWVLFIGVFEYSQKYGKTNNRQNEYLSIAKNNLKPDGALIIAIENKIGVKYINGAGEDHNSKLHYGIQDLYSDNDVTTWGKEELSSLLNKAGFDKIKYFGVFPDYKLPKVILSDDIENWPNFRADELLLYVKSHDYTGKNSRFFDDSLFYTSLRKNGLLVDLANSFLVVARFENTENQHAIYNSNVLAYYYSSDRRNEFRTKTLFSVDKLNVIGVQKIGGGVNFSINDMFGNILEISHVKNDYITRYIDGDLLALKFTKAISRGSLVQVNEILTKWMDFLLSKFSLYQKDTMGKITKDMLIGKELSSILIEGCALDCGPQNLIYDENEISEFDQEWVVNSAIPLSWVLKRNIDHILRTGYAQDQIIMCNDIIAIICHDLGITSRNSDVNEAAYLEHNFQSFVSMNSPSSSWSLRKIICQ